MKIRNDMHILIISHGYRLASGGPAQDIRDFLKDKVRRLDYIDHPFPHADYKQTYFFFYSHGSLNSTKKSITYFGFELFRYIQQFFVIFFFLLFSQKKYDICFALDNHSLIAVYFFKKIGRIRKLVYYSIDYVPFRFKNSFINYLYHLADYIACRKSDINWVVAKHMIKARADDGMNLKTVSQFTEVPMGFHKKEITIQPINKIDQYHLVYMGTILEKQGLELVIQGLPKILKIFPKISLTIIGTGDYENELKSLVRKLKIESIVTFKGFVGNKDVIYSILTRAAIGLAPYKPDPKSFSYYADPSKIKIYLGCGLPIITTNVTAFSEIIKNVNAGIVIDYSVESLEIALKHLLQNKKDYASFRKAALNLSLNYDTDTILKNAIDAL